MAATCGVLLLRRCVTNAPSMTPESPAAAVGVRTGAMPSHQGSTRPSPPNTSHAPINRKKFIR